MSNEKKKVEAMIPFIPIGRLDLNAFWPLAVSDQAVIHDNGPSPPFIKGLCRIAQRIADDLAVGWQGLCRALARTGRSTPLWDEVSSTHNWPKGRGRTGCSSFAVGAVSSGVTIARRRMAPPVFDVEKKMYCTPFYSRQQTLKAAGI